MTVAAAPALVVGGAGPGTEVEDGVDAEGDAKADEVEAGTVIEEAPFLLAAAGAVAWVKEGCLLWFVAGIVTSPLCGLLFWL